MRLALLGLGATIGGAAGVALAWSIEPPMAVRLAVTAVLTLGLGLVGDLAGIELERRRRRARRGGLVDLTRRAGS